MKRLIALLFTVALLLVPTTAWSVSGWETFYYQGELTDSLGDPVPDGSYSMVFGIYDDLSAGTLLWSESQSIQVTGGLFTALVGDVTPILPEAVGDPASGDIAVRYLEVTIQGETLAPRLQLSSVPSAFMAHGVGGHIVTAPGLMAIPRTVDVTDDVDSSLITFNADTAGASLSLGYAPDPGHTTLTINATGQGPSIELRDTSGSNEALTITGRGIRIVDRPSGILFRELTDCGNNTAMTFEDTTSDTLASFSSKGATVKTETDAETIMSKSGFGLSCAGFVFEDSLGDTLTAIFPAGIRFPDGTTQSTAGGADSDWSVVGDTMYSAVPGFVGIGTTSPAEKLDVDGNIAASGTITSGGTLTIDGDNQRISSTTDRVTFGNDEIHTTGYMSIGAYKMTSAYLKVDKLINTAETRWGMRSEIENSGTGNVMGIYAEVKSTNSAEDVKGIYANAYSVGRRVAVEGTAWPEDWMFGPYGGWGTGVRGSSQFCDTCHGVQGFSSGLDSNALVYGVYGSAQNGRKVYGVYGRADSGDVETWAGYFDGDVNVTGTLSKGAGSFRIDHPLDPDNYYLQHSFVESPDMMNIYNGNVTTNQDGEAVVDLPEYFASLNVDFRYQLTVIGQFAQAIIAEEISGDSFTIQTDKPNVKVSWQVTGIRNDAYARSHPIEVKVPKADVDRGRFLHPEALGYDKSMGIDVHDYEAERERLLQAEKEK